MTRRPWFRRLCLSVNDANAYLIACPATRQALLVDAGEDPQELDAVLQEHDLTLRSIFLTHGHYDHVDGVDDLKARYPLEVALSRTDADFFGVPADRLLEPGDALQVGEFEGMLVETSGHTPGGLSLIIGGYAFVGDALFAGAVGGTAGRGQFEQQIRCVRENLLSLPDSTIVCPGHGPCSTIGVERVYNGFFVG